VFQLHRKPVVVVYVRHRGNCPHREDESYPRCDCSKWLRFSLRGKQHRQPAGTRTWGVAEEKAQDLQKQLNAGEVTPTPGGNQNTPTTQPTITAAIQTFQAADNALSTGSYQKSIDLAQQSMRQFAAAQDQAGMLRAGLATVAAQDSALKFNDCLTTVANLLPRLARTRYRWLQAATLIDQGECLSASAELEPGMKITQQAWDLAKRFHYPELQLRAAAFGASDLFDSGNREQGLRGLRDGLATYWQSSVSARPGENLYDCLFQSAHNIGWPFVEAYALKQMLATFPPKDLVDQALERVLLADAQKRTGDYQGARLTLQTASAHLDALPNDSAVTLRKAEIAVTNAQIDLSASNAKDAITSLSPYRDQVEATGPGRFQAEYFRILGEAYLALGMVAQAQPPLQRALAVRETGLRNLQQESDKLAWSRGRTELYRDLLQVELKLKTPAESLAAWEWYKGAGYRSTFGSTGSSEGFDATKPPEARNAPAIQVPETVSSSIFQLRTMSVVAFIVFPDGVAAWVYDDRGIFFRWIKIPQPDLEALVFRFQRLCATRNSNLSTLRATGQSLYQVLLAPLQELLDPSRALVFEMDGVLDLVPVEALVDRNGRYLTERSEVVISPGLYQALHLRPASPITADSKALVVAVPLAADENLPSLPDAEREARNVASQFRSPKILNGESATLEAIRKDLKEVQVFHFAGHAAAFPEMSGLLLATRDPRTLRPVLVNTETLEFRSIRHLQLAVLSACNTGNGELYAGEGVMGLSRAFLLAGSKAVLASMWPVESQSTEAMMVRFYGLQRSGRPTAAALREAMLAIRKDKPHPAFWAPFILVGE